MSSVAEETMTMRTSVMTTPDTPDKVFNASFTASCNQPIKSKMTGSCGVIQDERINNKPTRKSYLLVLT